MVQLWWNNKYIFSSKNDSINWKVNGLPKLNYVLDTDFLHLASKDVSGENAQVWENGQEANYTQTLPTVIGKVYPFG